MERAVASGMLAANAILRRYGAAEEPLWTVRPRGFLARLVYGDRTAARAPADL
jgi:isorenieratene synthase